MSRQFQRLWDDYLSNPSEERFVSFYEETHRFVYSVCRHLLRNEDDEVDAVQAAYTRMVLHARNPEKDLSDQAAKQVLYRLTLREAQNLRDRRRRRNLKEVAMETIPDTPDRKPRPDKSAAQNQAREQIEVLLAQLPDKYRVPIFLHFFHEHTQKEISQVIGKTQVTVSRRLAKGIKILKPMMQRAGLEPGLLAGGIFAGSITLLAVPQALTAQVVYHNAVAAVAVAGATTASAATTTSFISKWMSLAKAMIGLKSITVMTAALLTAIIAIQLTTKPDPRLTSSTAIIDNRLLDGLALDRDGKLDLSLASIPVGRQYRNEVQIERQITGAWSLDYSFTELVEVISRDDDGNTLVEHRLENIEAEENSLSAVLPREDSRIADTAALSFRYKIDSDGHIHNLDILTRGPVSKFEAKLIIHAAANSYLRILPVKGVLPGDSWSRIYRYDHLDHLPVQHQSETILTFVSLTQKSENTLARILSETHQSYHGYGINKNDWTLTIEYLLDADTTELKDIQSTWRISEKNFIKRAPNAPPSFRALNKVSYPK